MTTRSGRLRLVEDLSVVGHEGFSDGIGAEDELLENLEGHLDDFKIAGVKGG